VGPIYFNQNPGQQGRIWDCSLVLVRYLETLYKGLNATVDATVESSIGALQGATVLELGCGTYRERRLKLKLLKCDSVDVAALLKHAQTLTIHSLYSTVLKLLQVLFLCMLCTSDITF
jgi:hypothetical protein